MRATVGVISGRKRDVAPSLVHEVVELPHDLVTALLRVQLERLERRSVVLHEGVAARHVAPRIHDERALRQFLGIEIAKSGEGAFEHPMKLAGERRHLQPRHGVAHSVK